MPIQSAIPAVESGMTAKANARLSLPCCTSSVSTASRMASISLMRGDDVEAVLPQKLGDRTFVRGVGDFNAERIGVDPFHAPS